MIVIAALREARLHQFGVSSRNRDLLEVPLRVEQQVLAVLCPVRCLDEISGMVHHPTVFRADRNNFQRAVHDRLAACGSAVRRNWTSVNRACSVTLSSCEHTPRPTYTGSANFKRIKAPLGASPGNVIKKTFPCLSKPTWVGRFTFA